MSAVGIEGEVRRSESHHCLLSSWDLALTNDRRDYSVLGFSVLWDIRLGFNNSILGFN